MLPYSVGFGVVSTIVFLLWVLLGVPLGPGAELYYVG
jgi:AbgT putative transporter family.